MKLVLDHDDLADAAIASSGRLGIDVEREEVVSAHQAMGSFVEDGAFDVCEIAIVTLLQAVAYGRPVILLPITTPGWAPQKKGPTQVNHVLAVREQTARLQAPAICAMYDGMSQALDSAPDGPGRVSTYPCGFAALRAPLTEAAEYALEQGALPGAVDYDDLVERSCGVLGITSTRLGG